MSKDHTLLKKDLSAEDSVEVTRTMSMEDAANAEASAELVRTYHEIINREKLSWTTHLHLKRVLGSGGQGSV